MVVVLQDTVVQATATASTETLMQCLPSFLAAGVHLNISFHRMEMMIWTSVTPLEPLGGGEWGA